MSYHFTRKHDSRVSRRTYLYLHDDAYSGASSLSIANALARVAKYFGYKASELKPVSSGYSWFKGRRSYMYSFKLTVGAKASTPTKTSAPKTPEPCTIRRPNIIVKRPTSDDITLYIEDLVKNPHKIVENRIGGKLVNHAVYLDDDYNWEIVKDDEGILCLIAKKKK